MLRTKNKLTVLHDDNSTFADYSNESLDFDRDFFTMELSAASDYLYIGFTKPISEIFFEIKNPNTVTATLDGEFYNGTTWTDLVGLYDETRSFKRSGYITWDRNQTDEAQVAVNSSTKNWVRFRPSVDLSVTIFAGINIIFASDRDLKGEFFEIGQFLPKGADSHILTHVAARDEIIQYLRNGGHFKQDLNTGRLKDITAFDLLDLGQIKQPAINLTLSKIFSNASDQVDDNWSEKASHYRSLYNASMKLFYLDIDSDDDGKQDDEERMAPAGSRIIRR